jgi:hypothetical protein
MNAHGITPDLVILALAGMLLLQSGNVGRQFRRGWRLLLRASPALIALLIEVLKQ